MREIATQTPAPADLFMPGRNCWRVATADRASVVVDVANYYRALHQAIVKAKRSIFVLGWDIDSRIELLRGQEAGQGGIPSSFFHLIKWKAQANPDLQIYLNRWDYTIYQASEREGLSLVRWKWFAPNNVHYKLDNRHPVGGCHHQKVVVIDDEIAFVGGMDIALGRWDYRSHHVRNGKRVDPGGTYQPHSKMVFRPHHDIMMLASGAVVRAAADLARQRWRDATGEEPIAFDASKAGGVAAPAAWPDSIAPQFTNVDVAVSRTMPAMPNESAINEVERLFIDQIEQAENFIYMENQYFCSMEIAAVLNRQLKAKPNLRVLLVSCWEPQGIMEQKAMWGGRVRFRDALTAGGVGGRTVMAFVKTRENGREDAVRIHSKFMTVDDRYLRVGSANINNRSMGLDTECDLTIAANDAVTRRQIEAVRNDLIREHTGWEAGEVQRQIDGGGSVEKFLVYRSESEQHLAKIDDEIYRHQSLIDLAIRLADPKGPLIGQTGKQGKAPQHQGSAFGRTLPYILVGVMLVLALLWKVTPAAHYLSPGKIAPLFEQLRHSVWAAPAVIGIYVVATSLFFPLTILILATAMSFPPALALPLALGGMMCSACCGYIMGRLAGGRFFGGKTVAKISAYVKNGGVAGVTLLRLVPIAPLGAVDFALGVTRVPFPVYILGTLLGMLPGTVIFTLLGHSLSRLWRERDLHSLLLVGCGFAGWIGIVFFSHYLVKRWRAHKTGQTL